MDYSKQSNQRKRLTQSLDSQRLVSKFGLLLVRGLSIAAFVAVFVVGGLLLGGFMGIIDASPVQEDYDISEYTSFLYDAEGNPITPIYTEVMRSEIGIDQISENLQHAVVAIEDDKFYEHNGIDIEGIIRSGYATIKGDMQGGSTITQQVIKNLALTSETALTRKIQEWYMALQYEYDLTQKMGTSAAKQKILETYLNMVNFGNGQYGALSASHYYFNKEPIDLSVAESAVLAGVLNAPSLYDPVYEVSASRERQLLVLEAMLKHDYITEDQYERAKKEDVFGNIKKNISDSDDDDDDDSSSVNYTYFEEAAMSQVQQDLVDLLGYSPSKAYRKVYYGGVKIYTTQDSKIQDAIDTYSSQLVNMGTFYYQLNYALSIYNEDYTDYENYGLYNLLYYSEYECEQAVYDYREAKLAEYGLTTEDSSRYAENVQISLEPEHTIVISDYHNGYVLGMSTGLDEKTVDMAFNRVTDTTRQPGSTFKVLAAFAPAIDGAGRSPAQVYWDVPLDPLETKGWSPKNWWTIHTWLGHMPIRFGIAYSMNLIAARCSIDIGPDLGYKYCVDNFGITTLVEDDIAATIALGGLVDGVSNLELNTAYCSIANMGTFTNSTFYSRVYDHEGNLLLDKTPGGAHVVTHQSLSEENAWILTSMMRTTVESPSGYACARDIWLPHGIPIAAKTGTSNDNNDYWIVAYSPYYLCSVWCGFDMMAYLGDYDSIRMIPTGYRNNDFRSWIWNNIMQTIHEDLEWKGFPDQPENVFGARVCMRSGLLAGSGCQSAYTYVEYFTEDNYPTYYCNVHRSVAVCTESGMLATSNCPSTTKYGVPYEEDLYKLMKHLKDDDDSHKKPDGTTGGSDLSFDPKYVEDFIPSIYCDKDHTNYWNTGYDDDDDDDDDDYDDDDGDDDYDW